MTEKEAKLPVEETSDFAQKPVREIKNAYIRMYFSQVADLEAFLKAAEVPTPKAYEEYEAPSEPSNENSKSEEVDEEGTKLRRRK